MTLPSIEIRPLSPELLHDFLAFFEGDAFADNPKWASCYCQFPHVDHDRVVWASRTGAENRAAACGRIESGRMRGLLAYRDGKPVGWCNAAPRPMLAALAAEHDPDAERIGTITCFIVSRPHRRSGVATALLQRACDELRDQGMAIVEAMPRGDASTDAASYHGPLAMYRAAGFDVHRIDDDGSVRVRKALV